MHKNILLSVGITILFLGLAIQPSVASIQPKQIDVKLNVNDIEGLVAQLRVAFNEKLEKYESIPKVANILEKILYLILFLLDEILFRILQVGINIILFPLTFIISPFILLLMLFMEFFFMG